MTQAELDALSAQHGGISGQTQTGPSSEPDPDFAGVATGSPMTRAIAKDHRQQKIVFKDGYHLTIQPDANADGSLAGTFQVVEPLAKDASMTSPTDKPQVRTVRGANGQDQIEVMDPSDPSGQTWVAVGGTVSNPDEDQIKAIQRQILEAQRNERQANADAGRGYLTNDQVATIDRDAQTNKTSAADVQIRRDQLSQSAHDAEVTAGLRQQEINNTATNQQADIALRTQAQKAQADAQKAANDLAAKRLELDTKVQNHAMSAEDAKQAYQEQYNAADLAVRQAAQLQTQVDAANREADATRTNATTVRGQDITAQDNAATRALNAGNDVLGATDREGTLGASILNDRATAARDTLNQTLSPAMNSKNFGLGGGLPSGFGSQLLGGINDWTAQLYGGQDTLKTAQDLIHNANPTLSGTPAGAGYAALLSQMLDAKKSTDASAGTNFAAPTGTNPASTQLPGQVTPGQYVPGGGGTTSPNVTVNPAGGVHIHFYAPTGSTSDQGSGTTFLGGPGAADSGQ